jgi:hypothetical protein
MDMHVDCSREYQKTCAIDHFITWQPGTDMPYQSVLDRDIRNAPIREGDVLQHEFRALFHRTSIDNLWI